MTLGVLRLGGDDYELSKAHIRAKLSRMQGGRCAVCRKDGPLEADHDHETGLLRGLLCHGCNIREGHVQSGLFRVDHPDIDAYLENPPAAGFRWMWATPDWWCELDDLLVEQQGMTVLEYVEANPGIGQRRREASTERAIEALQNIKLYEPRQAKSRPVSNVIDIRTRRPWPL